MESLFALCYHTCKTLSNFKAGFYTTGCLRINDCPCRHSLTEPSKQFYCYSLKKLQLITIFLLQLQGPCYDFNVIASEYYPVKCQIYNFRSAKRKYSISNAFDWTDMGTDFKFSTYFILHEQQIHSQSYRQLNEAMAGRSRSTAIVRGSLFLLDKSDLFVCIFVN